MDALTPAEREKRAELRKKLHEIELTEPDPPPAAYAVADSDKPAPATYILKVGDVKHKMGQVEPGVLTVLNTDNVEIPASSTGRRAALANWLASPEHPLTARVMVNRIWQFRMGTGIVATPNDFGVLGQRPTNQKLLDWLAVEFMEHNWSVKTIDRMIVLSSAYQQASADDPAQGQDRSRQQALLADESQALGGRDHSRQRARRPRERSIRGSAASRFACPSSRKFTI